MAKTTVNIGNGQIVEGDIVEFQEREPGKWLEFYLPDQKEWLRVKPVLMRVVKLPIPSKYGADHSYWIHVEYPMDVVPE